TLEEALVEIRVLAGQDDAVKVLLESLEQATRGIIR
ncbi:MAG: hypothetical protein ACI9OH_003997, partial [Oleispira sp.]